MQRRNYTPLKTYVLRKEWYYPRFGPHAVHYDKIVRGYSYKPDALVDAENLNKECLQCPTRTAQKAHYYLQELPMYVRVRNE